MQTRAMCVWKVLNNTGKKGKLVGHFSVHPEVPISFSLAIGPDYSIHNVAVRASSVLCATSLLPSQSKLVPICTPGLRGAS